MTSPSSVRAGTASITGGGRIAATAAKGARASVVLTDGPAPASPVCGRGVWHPGAFNVRVPCNLDAGHPGPCEPAPPASVPNRPRLIDEARS